MTATNQNFTMYAGDTENIDITVTDSGAPVDLTGASAIDWVLQNSAMDLQARVHKTLSNGITVTNATGGAFEVSLSQTDTKDIPPGTYYHEARVTDALGDVSTVTTGIVTLNARAKSY